MVSQKVRVFGLKTLFLKRFTVRSTTRTLIIDKTDHSAFTAILSDLISIQIPALVLYYSGGGCGVMMSQKSTAIRFKKVVFETFYG